MKRFVVLTAWFFMQMANAQTLGEVRTSAQKIEGAAWIEADCLQATSGENSGKCKLTFRLLDGPNFRLQTFNASPEVAAVYANYSRYINAPRNNLWIVVFNGEIIRINDSEGQLIAKKIDLSR